MKVLSTIQEFRAWRKSLSLSQEELVGFFPTMGALHEGHLDLARTARKSCKYVVTSIYVNSKQFAPHEDFASYPRQHEADIKKLEEAQVDALFLPNQEMMYPEGYDTYVDCEVGSGRNEGAVRPHFFRGVATVVCKLFNIVSPHRVFFGQKDAQQCVVIQHMVRDLNMDLEVVVVPTRREEDGLAMSSRNQYLSSEQRLQAPMIFKALSEGKALIEERGCRSGDEVREAMRRVLAEQPALKVQYASALHRSTVLELEDLAGQDEVLLAVAAFIGTTRLIDNVIARLPPA